MSMIGNFQLLTRAELDALASSPESVTAFIYGNEASGQPGADELHPERFCGIDKAWHGLHFLLTGTAWEGRAPLNFIVAGGKEVGDVDVGYGPARTFENLRLRNIVAALEALTVDELRERFDPSRMAELELYPEIWSRPVEEDDTLGYLISHFEVLKAFLHKGAEDGFALLVYLD